MPVHRASFAPTPMGIATGRQGAANPPSKLMYTRNKRADRNCPPVALNFACGIPAPQKTMLRETRFAGEQF